MVSAATVIREYPLSSVHALMVGAAWQMANSQRESAAWLERLPAQATWCS